MFPKILTELEYSGIGRNKEQSARLLRHMIANAPKLVKPYQEPILKVISIYMHYTNYKHMVGVGCIDQYQTMVFKIQILRYN